MSVEAERDLTLACLVAGVVSPQVSTHQHTVPFLTPLARALPNTPCSGVVSPQAQEATVRAVCGRLCAAGRLAAAAPMLFLIGRGVEACERLQAAGR